MNQRRTSSLPRSAQVKTPFLEDFDSSSSESGSELCELDLEAIGEAPGQQKKSSQTNNKMKKLQLSRPTLKLVKDYCFQGLTKASQRLSFASDESLDILGKNSQKPSFGVSARLPATAQTTFDKINLDSMMLFDMPQGGNSKTTATTNDAPFSLSPSGQNSGEQNPGFDSLMVNALSGNYTDQMMGAHLVHERSPFLSGDEQQILIFDQTQQQNCSEGVSQEKQVTSQLSGGRHNRRQSVSKKLRSLNHVSSAKFMPTVNRDLLSNFTMPIQGVN